MRVVRGLAISFAVLALLVVLAVGLLHSPLATRVLAHQLSERLGGREVQVEGLEPVWAWPPAIHLEGVRVANADWAGPEQMLQLDAAQVRLDPGAWLRGEPGLERVHLRQPVVHLARKADGTPNWAGLLEEEGPAGPAIAVSVAGGRLSYRDPTLDAELRADFETRPGLQGERHVRISGAGRLKGEPLRFSGRGDAPAEALARRSDYTVALMAELGETQLKFDGRVAELRGLEGLRGEVILRSHEPARLAAMGDLPLPEVEDLIITGELHYDAGRWALHDFQGELGASRFAGSVVLDRGGRVPEIGLRINARSFNPGDLGLLPEPARRGMPDRPDKAGAQAETQAWDTRLAERLAPLRRWRAEVDLRAERLLYGERALEDFELRASLTDDRLDLATLRFAGGSGAFHASGWLEVLEESLRGRVAGQLDAVDLGQLLPPFAPPGLGVLSGRFDVAASARALSVSDTVLHYRRPAQNTEIHLRLDKRELAQSAAPGIHLQAHGQRRGRPFEIDLTGGPLLDLDDPRPYPLVGELVSMDTRVHVEGTVTQPLRWQAADVQMTVEGANPADLQPLTDLPLPDLPPYKLQGNVEWPGGNLVRLNDVNGHVGESDVAGDLRVRFGRDPGVWATLHSNTLYLDNLLVAFGITPGAGEPSPRRAGDEQDEDILPKSEVERSRLSGDATVRYRADEVLTETLPLDAVDLRVELRDGLLTIDPFSLALAGGQLEGGFSLDTRETPVRGALNLIARRLQLGPLMHVLNEEVDASGTLGAQGRLRFQGRSIAEALASLDGRLELLTEGGRLDEFTVALAGVDLGRALLSAFTEDDTVALQCGYAHFQADRGIARLEAFLLSTPDINFVGTGHVNLREEKLELLFEGRHEDPALLALGTPIQVDGSFADPRVDAISPEMIARGLAGALAAVVAPPAGLVPLATMGDAEPSGCRNVLARTEADTESG